MSESPSNNPNLDSALQPPSHTDATIDVTPDGLKNVALHPPAYNEATLASEPDGSQNGSLQSGSYQEATIDVQPEGSQDGSFQSGSFNDATIDAPPDGSQDGSFNDATIDAPPEAVDATSCMTMEHLSTQVKEIQNFEADDSSFTLAGDNGRSASKPKNVIANYEILGVLGRGAVGVVYKARQMGLNRLVALKMLLAGSHAGQRELMRFRIEAEAVARLHHPNIVQVYEVGEHNGLPFFSLEFVEGGSLHGKMDGKPLPPRQGAEILEALSRAMHYAHEHNIIHRDLKPANVLVTHAGVPKITDFGLAKRLEENEESSQTRTGTLMGTPSYMSPEQASGRTHEVGPLSDQYTLGAILYEVLTGRPPFLGATLLETIQQVRTQEPVPPTQLQATTPRDLEVICLKALQKEPGKRYPHAGEMADDLKRFLNGEPIRARPVSLTERTWRWCRRNPKLASLYGTVAVLLVMVAIGGAALGVRMLREQQAVARIRDQADERMNLASDAISGGDVRRANDLLNWSDPLLVSCSDLSEQRTRWQKLRDGIDVYGEFKDRIDKVRFAYIFGSRSSRKQMEQGQEDCRKLMAMYDAIEQERMPLPELNPEQQKLFKDDVFDMFLLSCLIENEVQDNPSRARQKQVAQQALDWLDRADKILPGMRTLNAHRSGFLGSLGRRKESEDYRKLALSTTPTAAVDRFWHGYAEHDRGDHATRDDDPEKARQHYRNELAEYAALLQQHPDHFWGYMNWATAKRQLGDYEDALIGFTRCIELRPQFAWPYNNRGTVHLQLKQYDQAISDYNTALKREPEYVSPLSNRALAYLGQNKIDEALKDCDQALQMDPRHTPAYLHRAECYRRLKKYEEGLADCTSVLGLHENLEEAHAKREKIYEELKEAGDQARSKRAVSQDHKKAFEFYTQAQKHVSKGEYQGALGDYSAAVELYPQALEPHHYRAVVNWLYLRDFNAALNDWRYVVGAWPSKPEAYRFLATIHLGRRHYDLALEELADALSRKPDYADAIWAKAQVYVWQGKPKEALEVVNPLAQKLPPNAQTTLNVRGDIYQSLGRFDEAAADYRRLIRLQPEIPESYDRLAHLYAKQGDMVKARECLDQLVQANPKAAFAYFRRGRFLRDQGQFEEAWKDSEQAAQCDTGSVLPALLQSSIIAARGDHATAVATAEQALADAPQIRGEVVDGQVLYAAVQVYSLAAAAARSANAQLAEAYAERAVEFLARTLDKGYHDLNFPDHNRMIDDPALEAIRQNPKAQDLLAHRPV